MPQIHNEHFFMFGRVTNRGGNETEHFASYLRWTRLKLDGLSELESNTLSTRDFGKFS